MYIPLCIQEIAYTQCDNFSFLVSLLEVELFHLFMSFRNRSNSTIFVLFPCNFFRFFILVSPLSVQNTFESPFIFRRTKKKPNFFSFLHDSCFLIFVFRSNLFFLSLHFFLHSPYFINIVHIYHTYSSFLSQ